MKFETTMDSPLKVDVLNVGTGLAGTNIAHQLHKRGYSFAIFSDPQTQSASSVAAGLINPVTGRKMNKTKWADVLFPYLHEWYPSLEKELKSSFFHPIEILKIFSSYKQQNDVLGKMNDPEVRDYLSDSNASDLKTKQVHSEYGSIRIHHGAWLDTNAFLDNSLSYFRENFCPFIIDKFHYNSLDFSGSKLVYQNLEADYIIFCEGWHVIQNPFFEKIKMNPAAGEILDINIEKFKTNKLLNKKGWLLPIGGNKYRFGATYRWKNLDSKATEKGKLELIDKLYNLLDIDYSIDQIQAGVRPASNDIKPILGPSLKSNKVFIFNGLGSKGSSLAPYFSELLIKHIFDDEPIPAEVDVKRYYT